MIRRPPGRLHFLDGLRGVAATLVVAYHFNLVGETTLPGAYLAVDFFFALSGLVLAFAYQDRLRGGGLALPRVVELRVLRLYPLYAIGSLPGVGREVAKIVVRDPNGWSWGQLATTAGFAVLLLPDPLSPGVLYPLNTPAWSLLFELLANLAFAVLLVRLPTAALALIVGAALAALAGYGMVYGSFHYGDAWSGFGVATARVTAMFTVGVLCARFGTAAAPRANGWTLPVFCLFLAALAWPWTVAARWLPDLLFIGVATPALLLFGTRFDVPARWTRTFGWLGDISYPIYAVHAPLVFGWHMVARRLHLPLLVEVAAFVVAMLAFATALVPVDAAIRRRVSRWLQLRRSAMPQVVGR